MCVFNMQSSQSDFRVFKRFANMEDISLYLHRSCLEHHYPVYFNCVAFLPTYLSQLFDAYNSNCYQNSSALLVAKEDCAEASVVV